MTPNDYEPFALGLRRAFLACSAGQREPDAATVEAYFDLFPAVALPTMLRAIKAHMLDAERGKFPPRPADLTHQLQQLDGHPDPDAAWAIACGAADEDATVIWTPAIAQAWGEASALYRKNPVGAALAFKSVYAKLVGIERAQARPANWHPSLGFNKAMAKAALEKGIADGLIHVAGLGKEQQQLIENQAQLMIESSVAALSPSRRMAEALAGVYARLTGKQLDDTRPPTDHQRTEQLKAQAQAKFDAAIKAQQSLPQV
jgi:hypothetical protein